MELDTKKWTDLFKDTKSVRRGNVSRNGKLLKGVIAQNKIIYENIVFKTSAKVKFIQSVGMRLILVGKDVPFLS